MLLRSASCTVIKCSKTALNEQRRPEAYARSGGMEPAVKGQPHTCAQNMLELRDVVRW